MPPFHRNRLVLTFLFFAALSTALSAEFAIPKPRKPVVEVSTFWSATGLKRNGVITLAVVLNIDKAWHINSNTAKPPFIPTAIEFIDGPSCLRSSTPVFPKGKSVQGAAGSAELFSGEIVAFVPFAASDCALTGRQEIKIRVKYQACDEKTCLLPAEVIKVVALDFVPDNTSVQTINAERFQGLAQQRETLNIPFFGFDFQIAPSRLWLLLLIAGIGGFLLNGTPCVLPLVPIKMMSLSRSAGNPQRCLILGAAMSLGVVVFWMALGLAVSSIAGFDATNKLFQFPAFTIGVGVIICLMAVGMSGLFTVRLPQWIYRANPSEDSLVGSFLLGIMTAILSTPCTAPFMGAAAAWAVTQPRTITLTTFAAIGSGMALPYLLLSAFPGLLRRVPRAGEASELIKQTMSLLMLAAASYFVGTGLAGVLAQPPDPPGQAYWWVVAFFIVAAGGWLFWRTFHLTRRAWPRMIFGSLGSLLLLAGLGSGIRLTRGSPIHWVYYTPERFAAARSQSKVVVLEFTAAWCLNCTALEQGVLHQSKVVSLLNSSKVVPMKVDITGNNPAGNQKLIEVGRRTIPYLIVYSPQGTSAFASDAYTVDQLTREINKLFP